MKLRYILSLVFCITNLNYYAQEIQETAYDNYQNKNQHRQKPRAKQHKEGITKFFKPIKYSKSSIQCWLKHTYNDYLYGQKFLPFNLSHLEQFLLYTNQNEHPRSYAQSVIRLFTQKIKTVPFINAYAFTESVNPIYQLLKNKCNKDLDRKIQKHAVKKCLYSYLLKEFSTLKNNPDQALETLAENILDTLEDQEKLDIPMHELQNSVRLFLETTLNKLIWSSAEPYDIWPNVKQISKELELYNKSNIIPNDTLDELYWTLISKFCYFVELNSPELPQSFYKDILENISEEEELLWTLPEQEAFITTKAEYLRKTLITSSIANRAYNEGLIAT